MPATAAAKLPGGRLVTITLPVGAQQAAPPHPRSAGGKSSPGNVYAQSVRCLDIAEQALQEAGASLADVVRTRVMLTDIRQWRQAARAHAQRFAQVRPVTTFIEVSRFVDPEWLVEFELDAIVSD